MTDTSTTEPAVEPAVVPAEPAAVTPEPIEEPSALPEGTDFAELLSNDVDDLDEPTVSVVEPEIEEPPAVGGPPTETPPVETAPVTPPPTEVTPEVPPVVAAPAQEPPTDTPTPAVEPPVAAPTPEAPPPVPTMEELRETYQRGRTEAEETLTVGHYALSEEQVGQLEEGDPSLIPRLMSRVYMDAVTGAVGHMVANMPAMVNQVIQGQEQSARLEQSFFEAWPQLSAETHGSVVQSYAALYRQHNPAATAAEVIRDVGAQVVVAFKLPAGEAPAAAVTPAVPSVVPFKPAGTSVPRVAPAATNVFEELSDDLGREVLDLDA